MDKDILQARVLYYQFFGEVFNFLEKDSLYENIKQKLALFKKSPINDEALKVIEYMEKFLEKGFESLKEEQNDLFYSPITSFIPTSASFYDEQRDDGKKRIEMIEYLKDAGFVKDDSFKESEDHIGFICLFLGSLLQDANANNLSIFKNVFQNILSPFVDEFIYKLYNHENGDFYKSVAVLFDLFIKVERLG